MIFSHLAIPILFLLVIIGVSYFIFKMIVKSIKLKQEQNNLLKEANQKSKT